MISVAMKMLLLAVGAFQFVAHAEPQNPDAANRAVIKLSLASYTSAPNAVVIGAPGMGTRIDSIWISMKNLRFRRASSNVSRTYTDGPVTGELVRGTVSGLPDSAVLDAGQYGSFELQLRRSKGRTRGAPLDLREASVVVQGYRADGIRFLVRTRLDAVLALQAETKDGFTLVNGPNRVFLTIDAARLMSGINLAAAEITPTGPNEVIRVDDKSNTKILATFQRNLSPALALFRDGDGDGAFGPPDRGERGKLASGGP